MPEFTESQAAQRPNVVIIGAGPAGLTAAYELAVRYGITSTVLESDSVVGGISRTVERNGWRFDIGGHRFFTKVKEVEAFWHEVLPDEDFMLRPRMSRIYYGGKYYDYPLKASNALKNLGIIEALRCVLSYAWVRIHPPKDQTTLEGWIAALPAPPPPQSAATSTQTPAAPTGITVAGVPDHGVYNGKSAQRSGRVSVTLASSGLTAVSVRFNLSCPRGWRGPISITEAIGPLALKRSKGAWSFATTFQDARGWHFALGGSFSTFGTAHGTLSVTTRNGRCASNVIDWRAAIHGGSL